MSFATSSADTTGTGIRATDRPPPPASSTNCHSFLCRTHDTVYNIAASAGHTVCKSPACFQPRWRCRIATTARPPKAPERVEAAKAFAVEAARLAANTRCHQVVVLDVRDLSPVTDFFVLATGTSARQMRTVVDEIDELGASRDFKPLSRSGYEGETWILTDFVDVIVHVFNDEARHYYDLDSLWGDAKLVEWKPQQAAGAQP